MIQLHQGLKDYLQLNNYVNYDDLPMCENWDITCCWYETAHSITVKSTTSPLGQYQNTLSNTITIFYRIYNNALTKKNTTNCPNSRLPFKYHSWHSRKYSWARNSMDNVILSTMSPYEKKLAPYLYIGILDT